MDKKTKMLLGVGILAVAGYLVWQSQQPKANAIGAKTEPKEVTACRRACAGSSDNINCMGQCLDRATQNKQNVFANANGSCRGFTSGVFAPQQTGNVFANANGSCNS